MLRFVNLPFFPCVSGTGHAWDGVGVPSSPGYSFIGLVGLRDPPKPGVQEAIDECKTAGVQVVMVTGDHPLTAEAIGRQVCPVPLEGTNKGLGWRGRVSSVKGVLPPGVPGCH